MVRVKVCGITNLRDALCAVKAGCAALGFVFYKKSPRYIAPQKAAEIIAHLPRGIKTVGVFVDANQREIRNIARVCRLDMLQFHGRQSPDFCRRFKDYKIIKAFRIKGKKDILEITKYKNTAWLFDTFVKGAPGGTGKKFDWGLLRDIERGGKTIFLSGGLNTKNVRQAIKTVRPQWLDVSSSVEKAPGKKDSRKVKSFITAAKRHAI